MGMTMTQKILAAHAGLDSVSAGQLIEADLDLVLGNDITSPVAIHEIEKMKVDGVFDKDKIATCNGNMLAVYTLSEQLPFDTVVLTNKLCQEILKCFDDEVVQVSMTNNKVMFKSDKITLIGRLLDGKYPQYRAIIPKHEQHATINKSLVINAIELLKLIDEKSCTFNFNEDRLVISVGDSNTEIDIKYSGVEMSITFNSNYMINCLKNIDSEVIDFGFTDNRTGVTLSTDKELTLLMPIVR